MIKNNLQNRQRRRAIVLLIVITLLALFAVAALGFVYYANSESDTSIANRDATAMRKVDMDPGLLLANILEQLIYGGGDVLAPLNNTVYPNLWSLTPPNGLYSSMRGNEISRSIYGYNSMLMQNSYILNDPLTVLGGISSPSAQLKVTGVSFGIITSVAVVSPGSYSVPPPNPVRVTGGSGTGAMFNLSFNSGGVLTLATPTDAFNGANPNTSPFSGTTGKNGTLTFPNSWNPPTPPNVNFANVVNLKYRPGDGIIFDPERSWSWAPPMRTDPAQMLTGAYVGWNVPYSTAYPLFLGAKNTSGQITTPSFWRSTSYFGSMDPLNPNWSNTAPYWKYLVMRPHPSEHPFFPLPLSAGGNVTNFFDGPGPQDSIWIDFDLPIMTGPDGRKFKAMAAPLILNDAPVTMLAAPANLGDSQILVANQQGSIYGVPWAISGGVSPSLGMCIWVENDPVFVTNVQANGSGATVSFTATNGVITNVTAASGGTGYPASSTFALYVSGGGVNGVVQVKTDATGVVNDFVPAPLERRQRLFFREWCDDYRTLGHLSAEWIAKFPRPGRRRQPYQIQGLADRRLLRRHRRAGHLADKDRRAHRFAKGNHHRQSAGIDPGGALGDLGR